MNSVKSAISNRNKILAWGFISILLLFLSYMQYNAFLEMYESGAFKRPYIYYGIITWSIFGFYFYNMKMYLKNQRKILVMLFALFFIVLYSVVKTGLFADLNEFCVSAALAPISALVRGILFDKSAYYGSSKI